MEVIFLGLVYKLTQHQTCTLAICENFLQIYQWEDTLRNKKAILTLLQLQDQLFVSFFRYSSSNISFNLTHRINTARIRPKPPSSLRLSSGIASMYAKWNAPKDVQRSRCGFKTCSLTNSVWKIHLKFNKSVFRAPGLKRLQRLKIYIPICVRYHQYLFS